MAAAWTERRGTPGAAVAAFAAIVVVGAIDGGVAALAGFDFVTTAFYIVPIGFAAWVAGARTGTACAAFAALVEAGVTWWSARGRMEPWVLGVTIGLELLVFLGASFTFARLRWHLERHREASRTDALTGIPNQRAFAEAVRRELARAQRHPGPFSVIYLDVDRFKELNDGRGHAAGNSFLRIVGETLGAAVRGVDTAARLGGDEFGILLPGTGPDGCRLLVGRVQERLAKAVRTAGFDNTFSIGAITFEGTPPPYEEALAMADRAMYRVKHGSRDGAWIEVVRGESFDQAPARRATS